MMKMTMTMIMTMTTISKILSILMMININSINIILFDLLEMLTLYKFNVMYIIMFICFPYILLFFLIMLFINFLLIPVMLLVLFFYSRSLSLSVFYLIFKLVTRFSKNPMKYKPNFNKHSLLKYDWIFFFYFSIMIYYQVVSQAVLAVLAIEDIFIWFLILNLIYPIIYYIIYIVEKSKPSYKDNPYVFISIRISILFHLKCIYIISLLGVWWLGYGSAGMLAMFLKLGLIPVLACDSITPEETTPSEQIILGEPGEEREISPDPQDRAYEPLSLEPQTPLDETKYPLISPDANYDYRNIIHKLASAVASQGVSMSTAILDITSSLAIEHVKFFSNIFEIPSYSYQGEVVLTRSPGIGKPNYLGIVPEKHVAWFKPRRGDSYDSFKLLYVSKHLTFSYILSALRNNSSIEQALIIISKDHSHAFLLIRPVEKKFGINSNNHIYVLIRGEFVKYNRLLSSHASKPLYFNDLTRQTFSEIPGIISGPRLTKQQLNVMDVSHSSLYSYYKYRAYPNNLDQGKIVRVDYPNGERVTAKDAIGAFEVDKYKTVR